MAIECQCYFPEKDGKYFPNNNNNGGGDVDLSQDTVWPDVQTENC